MNDINKLLGLFCTLQKTQPWKPFEPLLEASCDAARSIHGSLKWWKKCNEISTEPSLKTYALSLITTAFKVQTVPIPHIRSGILFSIITHKHVWLFVAFSAFFEYNHSKFVRRLSKLFSHVSSILILKLNLLVVCLHRYSGTGNIVCFKMNVYRIQFLCSK